MHKDARLAHSFRLLWECQILAEINSEDPNCGFGGKSTKFPTDVVGDILKEFRYYAKLGFSREANKFKKSKMADSETKKKHIKT